MSSYALLLFQLFPISRTYNLGICTGILHKNLKLGTITSTFSKYLYWHVEFSSHFIQYVIQSGKRQNDLKDPFITKKLKFRIDFKPSIRLLFLKKKIFFTSLCNFYFNHCMNYQNSDLNLGIWRDPNSCAVFLSVFDWNPRRYMTTSLNFLIALTTYLFCFCSIRQNV